MLSPMIIGLELSTKSSCAIIKVNLVVEAKRKERKNCQFSQKKKLRQDGLGWRSPTRP